MRTLTVLLALVSFGCSSLPSSPSRETTGAAGALSWPELHRLSSYLVFLVVTADDSPAPAPTPGPDPTPSGECPSGCDKGFVGDGRVMVPCLDPACPFKKSSSCTPTDEVPPADEPATEDNPPAPGTVLRLPGPRWTFSGYGVDPPAEVKRSHLAAAHGIDATGLSTESMSAMHDNIHGHGAASAYGAPCAKDCPSGTCPSSSGSSRSRSSSGSTRTRLFGRWLR